MTAEELAASVRAALSGVGTVRELKMFGGIGFMLNGNLIAGASGRGLLVRVGRERERRALARRGARVMEMRGRLMAGYIRVDLASLSDRAVKGWVRLALPHVQSLPPKRRSPRARVAKRRAGN